MANSYVETTTGQGRHGVATLDTTAVVLNTAADADVPAATAIVILHNIQVSVFDANVYVTALVELREAADVTNIIWAGSVGSTAGLEHEVKYAFPVFPPTKVMGFDLLAVIAGTSPIIKVNLDYRIIFSGAPAV